MLSVTSYWQGRVLTERSRGHNLHSDLRSGNDGVVGVGLEARVHAALQLLARSVEGRLGNGVVHGVELEDDGVTNGNVVELRGGVDEASGSSNGDGVGGTGSSGGRGLSSHRHGLGDGDLRVVGRGSGTATGVSPDDDDLGQSVGCDAVAGHAIGNGDASLIQIQLNSSGGVVGIGILDLVGQSKRRRGQS